jgi:NodT family efflux transporter outer membrane factor (OMF) lipoprotein
MQSPRLPFALPYMSCRRKPLSIAIFAALLAGCAAVGPHHVVPEVNIGQGWQAPQANPAQITDISAWWRTLGDPELTQVVERALARNLDLRQAEANIEASRAMLQHAQALGSPVLSASGSTQRRRLSVNSPEYNKLISPNQTFSDMGLDASWEIDLFGSLRRQRESAQASLQETEAEAAAQRISIAAETARTYFMLRGAQRELAARQTSVKALQQILTLVQIRQQAGDVPLSEVDRARARLDQAREALPGIEAQRQAAVLALSLLAGDPPEAMQPLSHTQGPDIALTPIPVGGRADILRRRPDIIAAERKLAAATADTGVATAELFPKLTLSASGGFRALSSANLLDPDSRRGSISPLISWRILDGGQVRAEIRSAQARQQGAAIGYEKAVLSALADAEKALDQYQHALQSISAQQTALASTGRLAATMRSRYEQGDVSLADALDAERELADQQATLAQLQTSAASDMATLYKSLGGGWEPHGS